jgi:hypothetical protein
MKPRKLKKQRHQSRKTRSHHNFDLCEGCGNPNCDPAFSMGKMSIAMTKIQKRLRAGECMGCGKTKKECHCKSE